MASHHSSVGAERGFTYLGLLLAIALIGIGLTAASEVWVTTARHQKVIELEWIGAQFVQAIGSYYEASPGSVKVYPTDLEELLEDHRYLTLRRHLRQIYANPLTGSAKWEPVHGPGGRLQGVRVLLPAEFGGSVREFVYVPG